MPFPVTRSNRASSVGWISVFVILILVTGACQHLPPEPVEPAPHVAEAPVEQPSPFLTADELHATGAAQLAAGDLINALETYRKAVKLQPEHPATPQILFQTAILNLTPSAPTYDQGEGVGTLRRLVEQYSSTQWGRAASAFLAMAEQNTDLSRSVAILRTQLDQLKSLDLSSEE